jgi:hypothetical protein
MTRKLLFRSPACHVYLMAIFISRSKRLFLFNNVCARMYFSKTACTFCVCSTKAHQHYQCDRIGRIFAHWVTVFFWQFFLLQKSTNFFGCFVPQKRFVCINLTKMSWVAFFAIFSTNSSGHPEHYIHRYVHM